MFSNSRTAYHFMVSSCLPGPVGNSSSRPRLTLDWSVLEAPLLDAWMSESSVQKPQESDLSEFDAR